MDPLHEPPPLPAAPIAPIANGAGTGGPKKKLAIGRILAETWRLYTRSFVSIAAIVAVVWAPMEVLSSYMDFFVFGPEEIWKSFRFAQLVDNFVGIIATAGVTLFGLSVLSGERASVGASLSGGLKAWGRMWVTRFVSGLGLLVGLLLLVLPGLYLLVRWCLAETIAVCEHTSGTTAISRSSDLTRGRFWEIFRLGLALMGLATVALIVIFLPTALFSDLDHWLVDAATNLLVDIMMAFGTLCFLCVYRELTAEERERLELPQVFQ